jgi:hypothetical protein
MFRFMVFVYLLRRIPVGMHLFASDNHRTAPLACTVLFMSHPFGVVGGSFW